MSNILASVAAYETEVRSEWQMAGIAAAKAAGVRFGRLVGSKHSRIPADKRKAVVVDHREGWKVAQIARSVGLARKTVYAVMQQ